MGDSSKGGLQTMILCVPKDFLNMKYVANSSEIWFIWLIAVTGYINLGPWFFQILNLYIY